MLANIMRVIRRQGKAQKNSKRGGESEYRNNTYCFVRHAI